MSEVHWIVGGLMVAVVATSSCGGATISGPSPHGSTPAVASFTPKETPTPVQSPGHSCTGSAQAIPAGTVAIERIGAPWKLELIDNHRLVLNEMPIGDPTAGPYPVGVGCRGVYLFDTVTGELERLGMSGGPDLLGVVAPPGGQDTVAGAAEAPDGSRWIYSVVSFDSHNNATSNLYVGSTGSAPRLVATLVRPNFSAQRYGGGYQVLRWDVTGVLLGSDPTNVGGAGPFIDEDYTFSTVVRLNPDNGSLSPESWCQGHGRFGDIAPDGTEACASGGDVIVVHPNGSVTTITNTETQVGQVAFVGGSSTITYCATDGMSASFTPASGAGWEDTLYVVSLGAGAPSRRTLLVADNQLCENALAFDKVDGPTIAELTGQFQRSSLTLINVYTDQASTLGLADAIFGMV